MGEDGQLKNVQQIQASACALVAILGDGSIVTWVLLAVGLTAELSRIR